MFAAKHYPEQITGAELDLYLSKGWYRMGQTIFTTHFLCFGQNFYSAIWIRLDLEQYAFRKSLRKLLKKNDQVLDFNYGPARIDPAREELYALYRKDFPGIIAPSILDSLQDGEHFNIYNTLEFTAYLDDELVALSYFDIGQDSISSILGIYHPAHKDRSLGFYTMLKEIEYCLDHGIRYYYPGYVVPGYTRFDYKTRIGATEYYCLDTEDWEPFSNLQEENIPINLIQNQLLALQEQMAKAGLQA
ncbi:MAG: GNAT family N-acetyltransferase, partial [Bacteroidota bacterium]